MKLLTWVRDDTIHVGPPTQLCALDEEDILPDVEFVVVSILSWNNAYVGVTWEDPLVRT